MFCLFDVNTHKLISSLQVDFDIRVAIKGFIQINECRILLFVDHLKCKYKSVLLQIQNDLQLKLIQKPQNFLFESPEMFNNCWTIHEVNKTVPLHLQRRQPRRMIRRSRQRGIPNMVTNNSTFQRFGYDSDELKQSLSTKETLEVHPPQCSTVKISFFLFFVF